MQLPLTVRLDIFLNAFNLQCELHNLEYFYQ